MTSFINRIQFFKILLAFSMFGLLGASLANEETVLHFISSETPPFWSQSLYLDGMCGEILHEISKQSGVKSVIEYQPTPRIKEMVGSNLLGNPDLFLSNHDFVAIIPVAVFHSAIFYYKPHHKKGITFNRMEDLKGYTIGIMKGSLSNADISSFKKLGIIFEESYSKESLFKKLVLGRIDLCIEIELSGLVTLKKLFPDKINHFARLEIQRSITPIAVMIEAGHPNGKRLGKELKKGLEAIIKNKKYQRILEKFYGEGDIPGDWFKLLGQYQLKYDLTVSIF